MVNRLKHLNSTSAGTTPPSGTSADRGRIALNIPDRKLWAYNASGTPELLACFVGDHRSSSAYRVGDVVVHSRVLYRCTTNIPPKAFSSADWETVADFREELLLRNPESIAGARMTMGAANVGARFRAHSSQSVPLVAWEATDGTIVSDIRPDGYPGATFGRPVFRVDQVAHGFTAVGQAIRFTGSNWVLADASVAGGFATAIVRRVLSSNAFEAQTSGRVDGLQAGAFAGGTIAANTRYYLSNANPGQLTSSPPPNPSDENVVLHTTSNSSAIINIQTPVGAGGAGGGSELPVTQSPNPFDQIGLVAAIDDSGWRLAAPASAPPVGIVSATSGNDFAVALSGEVVDIEAAAVASSFPMTPGTVYYSTSAGLLTDTPPLSSLLGAGPVLIATSGTSGVVVAGQASPNALRASQNLGDLASPTAAVANLGLDDVVRETRTISAGTGLTGGGNLSSNRTLSLSSAAQTSLELADTAVQAGRIISSGAGLTGGGDLSADRTLALTGQALALHEFQNTGFIIRTGDAAYTSRSIAAGDGVSVSNGTGVSGNPLVAVDSSVVRTSRTLTAGDGLSGGGNLGADRSFSVDSTVVRTGRQIGSGDGLTGGGNLSANRTLAVDSTVVRTSRSLIAGAGLSGGGDLSQDRTLSVDRATADQIRALDGLDTIVPNRVRLAAVIQSSPAGGDYAPDWGDFISRNWTLDGNSTLQNPTNVMPGTTRILLPRSSDSTERTISYGSQYRGDLNAGPVTDESRLMIMLFAAATDLILVSTMEFET